MNYLETMWAWVKSKPPVKSTNPIRSAAAKKAWVKRRANNAKAADVYLPKGAWPGPFDSNGIRMGDTIDVKPPARFALDEKTPKQQAAK